MSTSTHLKDGKVKWKNLTCPLLMKNYRESMEKQWNSSGISSQDLRRCRFFRRSRMINKSGTRNLRNSHIGSSSCQCSTILVGQEEETMMFVFRIQKKSRCTRRNSRRDIGRSSVLETRRSGTESANINLKESRIP